MENEKLQEQTESMADYEAHFDDANPWNVVARYQEEGTTLHVKVEGIVNGGVIAMVEGLRGFIPASRLSLSYIEDLETYLLKEIDVRVIEANQAEGRLILSAREILREQKKEEDAKKLASVQVGSVVKGTVESLQSYGAFVRLENGLSGLGIFGKKIGHRCFRTYAHDVTRLPPAAFLPQGFQSYELLQSHRFRRCPYKFQLLCPQNMRQDGLLAGLKVHSCKRFSNEKCTLQFPLSLLRSRESTALPLCYSL